MELFTTEPLLKPEDDAGFEIAITQPNPNNKESLKNIEYPAHIKYVMKYYDNVSSLVTAGMETLYIFIIQPRNHILYVNDIKKLMKIN